MICDRSEPNFETTFHNTKNPYTELSVTFHKIRIMEWTNIKAMDQLEEIAGKSNNEKLLIFKHSTRCGVSRMVLRQFESEFDSEGKIIPYFLDLLQHRNISNEIADRFSVQHQSPQVIVVQNGQAIYNASHDRIDAQKLKGL